MKRFVPVLSGAVMAIVLFACSGASAGTQENNDPPSNTDPKQGWVHLWDQDDQQEADLYKRCDGTTLVYWTRWSRGGVSVVPNSPECK